MRPWVRLYREDMTDVTIGSLSDRLYRRYHECLRLAAKVDDGGRLPDLAGIAYQVRAPELEVQGELAELVDVGLLSKDGADLSVTRWTDEQPVMSDAERKRAYRDSHRTVPGQSQDCPALDTDKIRQDTDKTQTRQDTHAPNGARTCVPLPVQSESHDRLAYATFQGARSPAAYAKALPANWRETAPKGWQDALPEARTPCEECGASSGHALSCPNREA